MKIDKASVNPARSLYYGLFSKLFVFSQSEDRFDKVTEVLGVLIENPIDDASRDACVELKFFIENQGVQALSDEYDLIFNVPSGETVRTTASYYDEGFESGKKLVEVKNFLAKTKIRRDEKHYKESEDSIGFLVTFMHELIELIIKGESEYENLQHCLFKEVLNEFLDEFVQNLYENKKAVAYKEVAILLNSFLEFERLYFEVSKPKAKLKQKRVQEEESCGFIADVEAQRRAKNRIERSADALVQSCSLENDDDFVDAVDDETEV
jgi:TorA maturation chaperone TorD